jgi:hypothetical protein
MIEQVDQQVGVSERKVSCGQATQAMVLNGLGFTSRALYLVPDYMKNRPVDVLIGEGLNAEDFNDDTLGRSLDDLYEAGVTEMFASVASRALQVYGIRHRFVHLDSSSLPAARRRRHGLHVHGEYAGYEEEGGDVDRKMITMVAPSATTITEGFLKDHGSRLRYHHRPDLKQAVVTLITSQASTIPVWLEALSGNSNGSRLRYHNDRVSFPKTVQAYCLHLGKDEQPYYIMVARLQATIMDSAGYSEENLKAMESIRWLTRVPETLKQAKELVSQTQPVDMTLLEEGYWGREITSEYGGIRQRWLVVYSEAARQREERGLERKQAKELETAGVQWLPTAQPQWRKLMQESFMVGDCPTINCQACLRRQADAEHALAQFNQTLRYQCGSKVGYHQVQAQIETLSQYARRGRPGPQDVPQVVGYRLQGELKPDTAALERVRATFGKFMVAGTTGYHHSGNQRTGRAPTPRSKDAFALQGTRCIRGTRLPLPERPALLRPQPVPQKPGPHHGCRLHYHHGCGLARLW